MDMRMAPVDTITRPYASLPPRMRWCWAALVSRASRTLVFCAPRKSSAFNIAQAERIREKGFAAIYVRVTQILLKSLQARQLEAWRDPPLLLVRPRVWSYPWFSFANVPDIIEAGYRSALEVFERACPDLLTGGIWPRNRVEISVDPVRCTRVYAVCVISSLCHADGF
jgi:predicted acylesterase/phospholipase RssA